MLSQRSLAKMSGVSGVAMIESGARPINPDDKTSDVLLRLANALECTVGDIVGKRPWWDRLIRWLVG